MQNKVYGVYIGRFSPFHKGHEMILRKMISEYGINGCLVLIGSSTSYNERTPYTFEERRKMIATLFPKIKILPLPDINPKLTIFDGGTNEKWLESIGQIEREMKAKFIFLGGSAQDLEILSQKFDTRVISNRDTNGLRLSATLIRDALSSNDLETVKEMVNKKNFNLIVEAYNNFRKNLNLTK